MARKDLLIAELRGQLARERRRWGAGAAGQGAAPVVRCST
jgi:hypothetical protein